MSKQAQGYVCPRCGSANIKFQMQSAGIDSTSNHYHTGATGFLIPANKGTYSSTYRNKTVGFCPDCGYQWTAYEDKKSHGCLFYLLCFLFWPIALPILFYQSDKIKMKKGVRLIIIIGVYALLIIAGLSGKSSNSDPQNVSIWASDYTDISEFDYYIEANEIHLKEYNGSSKKVNIAPAYEIDGTRMNVVSLDGTFVVKRTSSIIVPEGVVSMSRNVFNSCGATYYYLPSTLTDFDGWSYFHDVEKIYYGGTEDQWAALIGDYDRSRLEVKQIICNASPESLS